MLNNIAIAIFPLLLFQLVLHGTINDALPTLPSGSVGDLLCSLSVNPKAIRLHNWGGNVNFSTQNIQYPRSVSQVQYIVRNTQKLRVLGSRHSFNPIADSPCTILDTLGLNSVLSFNYSVPSVTVQSGIYYSDLAYSLNTAGYALKSLAALTEISVAGATQTGSHGSGLGNGGLATQIRSLDLVKANGELETIGNGDPRLKAVAVGLGAFGVITQLELDIVPYYNLTQYTYVNMPIQNFYDHFDEIQASGYNVMCINVYTSQETWDYVIINVHSDVKNVSLGSELYGAQLASQAVYSWDVGLLITNFGLQTTDGDQIQTEYFVPYANAVPAIKAVLPLFNNSKYSSNSIGMLIRTIKADDLWMSEFYGNTTMVAIHFSWLNNMTMLKELLPSIEQRLIPYGAHPHWGKMFTMSAGEILPHYPKLEEWKKLVQEMDPNQKFRNQYLDMVFSTNQTNPLFLI